MAVLAGSVLEEFGLLSGRLSGNGVAVIVEGVKDKAALEAAGVSSSCIFVLGKAPLFAVAEAVAKDYEAASILTDLDSEGRRLYGRLNTSLQSLGVRVDDSFRNFLFRCTRLRQIEGLQKIIPQ